MINKKLWLVIAILVLFTALATLPLTVKAFGITSAYYSGNPLTLQPGETKTISLGLQNMVGEDNITLSADITKGAEIAKLVEEGKQYFVPLGTNNDIAIEMTITAPANDVIGKEYEVELTLTTVTSGEGGGVVLGQSIGKTVPVIIVSPTEEIKEKPSFPIGLVILLVVIVIIILVIIILLATKKKNKKK